MNVLPGSFQQCELQQTVPQQHITSWILLWWRGGGSQFVGCRPAHLWRWESISINLYAAFVGSFNISNVYFKFYISKSDITLFLRWQNSWTYWWCDLACGRIVLQSVLYGRFHITNPFLLKSEHYNIHKYVIKKLFSTWVPASCIDVPKDSNIFSCYSSHWPFMKLSFCVFWFNFVPMLNSISSD